MPDKLTQVQEHPDIASPGETMAKKRSSAGWVWLLVLIALAGGGYYAWRSTRPTQAAGGAARGRAQRDGTQGGGGGAVPVIVAAAMQQNLPVYLDGLGAVSAFNTVTLKSRVDGELVDVRFTEGQDVKKGDLLAVIDPRPFQVALAQAQATLAKDQAQLADVKLDADRYSALVKQGVIAQQQYDTQHALAGQLDASVASDQAQIENAKLNLAYSQITSPLDGRVGLRLVDQGNIVHATDPNGLLVITQMEPVAVIFTLPEDSLPAVLNRMREGKLTVKAMSRDNGVELAQGSLLTIDNQIDQTTGTFRLKAVFDNKDRALWPNQFVNARLLLNVMQNAIVVPAAAVQTGSQGAFVYAVKQNKTVEVRPVTVALTQENIVAVGKGLARGEQVVTDGQDKLRDGSLVDPRQDARPAGTAAAPNAEVAGTPPAPNGDAPRGAAGRGQPGNKQSGSRSGYTSGSDPQTFQGGRQAGQAQPFLKPKS